jgi:hypothetical protein
MIQLAKRVSDRQSRTFVFAQHKPALHPHNALRLGALH